MIPELWNVYDYDRNDTGRLVKRGARLQADEYHLVVNVWLKNAQGEYLISRRAPEKAHPLCWEATGGSVLAGETSVQGAVREVAEELGIRLNPGDGVLLCGGHRQYDGCPDILDVWVFNCDVPVESIVLQEGGPWTRDTLPSKKSGAWFNPENSFQWSNSIICTNWEYNCILLHRHRDCLLMRKSADSARRSGWNTCISPAKCSARSPCGRWTGWLR